MKKPKTRNSLTKTINKIAQSSDHLSAREASTIAKFGRRLTRTECLFADYYDKRAVLKRLLGKLNSPEKDENRTPLYIELREQMESWAKVKRDVLCERFMLAVDDFDVQAIHDLADSVRFMKKCGGTLKDADPERAALLLMKRVFGEEDEMPIREVARYVEWLKNFGSSNINFGIGQTPNDLPKIGKSEDGFSALRRKCRDLKFPIKSIQKNKEKKSL